MTKNSKIPTVHRYQNLFFDLDHTLWDFDANAKDSLIELYDSFELSSKAINSFEEFYQVYLVHNGILWSRFEKGYISIDELKWKRMWRTLLDFKIADEALAKEMSHSFLELLPTKSKVFDYTFEILEYLKTRGYRLHLLSNGFEKTQHEKLRNSNLASYFDKIITSEGSNSMKPKKEIFDFALRVSESTIGNSIMLGDNVDADIAGAKNAGMDAVFVNHTSREIETPANFEVRHLKELENIL